MRLKIFTATVFLIISLFFIVADNVNAQTGLGQDLGIIRIAEVGQLGDTLSVWGDVRAPGRYMVPRGASLAKVMQYVGGPTGSRIGGNRNPWGRSRISISISQFNHETMSLDYKEFRLRYNDEIPMEIRTYTLQNDDIIMVEVRPLPSFLDILGVVGPVLGTITTVYLAYDRFLR